MRKEILRGLTAFAIMAGTVLSMSACGEIVNGNNDLKGTEVLLKDGRTVICVENSNGTGLSCDWDHAVNKVEEKKTAPYEENGGLS